MQTQTINNIFAWKTWKTILCEGIHSHAHYAMNAKNLQSTNNLENKILLSTVNSTLPETLNGTFVLLNFSSI